jgi:exodeoxyribonuclease VII large subunit
MQKQLNADKQQFGQLVAQLEGVSPLATLARGSDAEAARQGR